MRVDKIGQFILKLRNEKGLTQKELADSIPIGREAVSKWERGITIPDSSTLIRLSEIFDVSINEILYGERINKKNNSQINNITLSLYESNNKNKQKVRILLIIIVIVLFSFLIYYFISSYKAIKVYTITGYNNDVLLMEGLFINTKNKLYFRIDSKESDDIKELLLFYKDRNDAEQFIYKGDDSNISFIDFYGYDEYFNSKDISYIINNLYIKRIDKNDNFQIIKLDLIEDYVNDNLFFIKKNKISDEKEEITKNSLPMDMELLVERIQNKFNIQNDNYYYEKEEDGLIQSFVYTPKNRNIYFTLLKNSKIIEEWSYDFDNDELTYIFYDDDLVNFSFSYANNAINCLKGICDNEKNKIEEFWENIYNLISNI